MPISACKPHRSATTIISGDIQISSSQEAPSKKSAKEPRLETNPLLSKLRPRSSSVTAGAQSETSSSLRIKAAPFLTVPKSLDAYAIDSSVPYQFQPSKIAIIGGGLTGVISALKLRSLGTKCRYSSQTKIFAWKRARYRLIAMAHRGIAISPRMNRSKFSGPALRSLNYFRRLSACGPPFLRFVKTIVFA